MFYIQSNEIRENIEKIYCIFLLAHFGFSISYNFLISGQNTECGYAFLNFIVRNILVIKLPGFTKFFSFFTSAPVVSVVEDRHIMQRHCKYMTPCVIMYDVI